MPPHDPKSNGYMHYRTIQYYYSRLIPNPPSPEDVNVNVFGHLWYNILRQYFLVDDGFGLEVLPHPAPGVSKHSDDADIRCVRKGSTTPLSLIEHKPASASSSESSERRDDGATWREAVRQLTEFMIFARMTSSSSVPDQDGDGGGHEMVGIITIGRHSRFYVLRPGQQQLDEHPATGGAVLEFKEDEKKIVDLLMSVKAAASQSCSGGSSEDTCTNVMTGFP